VTTAILPHLLKRLIDQERPDRCMVHGRRRGIPRSGKAYDAFPSGHAMHVGAVASAVSWAYPKSAPIAWGLGGLIAATRIVLLAHWTTDVLAGLAMGALVERCLRPLSKSADRADIEARPTRACTPAQRNGSSHPVPPWDSHDPDRHFAGRSDGAVSRCRQHGERHPPILGRAGIADFWRSRPNFAAPFDIKRHH